MTTQMEIMLCVNDDRNGAHTGRVDGIDLIDSSTGDIAMSLRGLPLKCGVERANMGSGKRLRVGHMTLRVLTYATWVGNWCWDSARVELADAARLVNYLRKRRWDCEQGYTTLYEAFEAGKDVTVEDLEYVLLAEVSS